MSTADYFRATAATLRVMPPRGTTRIIDGGYVNIIAICEKPGPHLGSCPQCRFIEVRDRDVAAPLARLLDMREPLAALLEETAALVEEYPDLGREHVDGEPCDDFACGIVTRLRSIARFLSAGGPASTSEETAR